MSNKYVIGSIKQAAEIKEFANSLSGNVRYVKDEKIETNVGKQLIISKCFENIKWANIVYVFHKEDGSIGDGTLYELEFAKYLHKTIIHNNPYAIKKFLTELEENKFKEE